MFHISLLEWKTTKIGWVDNSPESEKKFETRNNKKDEFKAIVDSTIYGHKVENYLSDLCYLVL